MCTQLCCSTCCGSRLTRCCAPVTDACRKGQAAAPHHPPHLQVSEQGTAPSPTHVTPPPSERPASWDVQQQQVAGEPQYAVDPIEAPAPAWILDAAGHDTLPRFAYSASRHVAASGGTQSQSQQSLLSAQPGAAWQAKVGSWASSASAADTQTGFPPSAGMIGEGQGGSPAPGSPPQGKGKETGPAWPGFAAHERAHTGEAPECALPAQGSAGGAGSIADQGPSQRQPAPPEAGQQARAQASAAAFTGFDVPEEDLPEEGAAPEGQGSPQGVRPVASDPADKHSGAVSTAPDGTAGASQVIPANSERKPGASPSLVAKGGRHITGPMTPAKTYRSSSAVISRGPTEDEASGEGGAGKAAGTGPVHKDGWLSRGRSTSAVSGAALLLGHISFALPLQSVLVRHSLWRSWAHVTVHWLTKRCTCATTRNAALGQVM